MKIKETKTWKLSELSEETRESAIEKLMDINVDFEWWDLTFEDALNIGIKIDSFDIDRGSYCDGSVQDPEYTAVLIKANHGEKCETFKTATQYQSDRAKLVEKYSDGINTDIVAEDNEYDYDCECDELNEEFTKSLLEDYRIMLRQEYDYRTTEEVVIETIDANDYDFDIDGNIF